MLYRFLISGVIGLFFWGWGGCLNGGASPEFFKQIVVETTNSAEHKDKKHIFSGCANKAFPGAQGFGSDTPAGRGGTIIKVTNLNDSGVGSLREAIGTAGPRIIVFEVGGTIDLKSDLIIRDPFCTISGQTAPPPGIHLKGWGIKVMTHDLLVRHLTVRPGHLDRKRSTVYGNLDCIQVIGDSFNVVIDHVSGSWSTDEAISVYGTKLSGVSNVTISNCIIAEPLSDGLHPEGEHSKAILVSDHAINISLIQNFFGTATDRLGPMVKNDAKVEVLNNIFYNNGGKLNGWTSVTNGGGGLGEDFPVKISIIGNTFKKGPSFIGNNIAIVVDNDCVAGTQVYADDNWTDVDKIYFDYSGGLFTVNGPKVYSGANILKQSVAVDFVLKNSGSRPSQRDSVDIRVIKEYLNNSEVFSRDSGKIINHEQEVGGYPVYVKTFREFIVPRDPHGDDDGNGCTNIDELLQLMAYAVEH